MVIIYWAAIMYAVFGSAINYYFSGQSLLENKILESI